MQCGILPARDLNFVPQALKVCKLSRRLLTIVTSQKLGIIIVKYKKMHRLENTLTI